MTTDEHLVRSCHLANHFVKQYPRRHSDIQGVLPRRHRNTDASAASAEQLRTDPRLFVTYDGGDGRPHRAVIQIRFSVCGRADNLISERVERLQIPCRVVAGKDGDAPGCSSGGSDAVLMISVRFLSDHDDALDARRVCNAQDQTEVVRVLHVLCDEE